MKRGSAAELRHCLGQGASLSEEAALADSGRADEKSRLFEHPAEVSPLLSDRQAIEVLL